ncbi:MAG TPA: DUF4388 domain-containing protein [Anaeromyxobacter sp.]
MALLLDIDAHGRVIAQGDAARSALADRAGRFVLLPAAADLLVARRTPATDASSARPRCVLAGDLSAFPIADFIAFLQQARLSGTLTVSSGGSDRVVCFQVGEVRSAESSAAGERLGEVAVRLGYVTEAQVADATRTGNAVGKALLELGHLNANDLYKCLHEQVAAVFHALLLCHTGSFALVDEAPPPPLAPLTVSTQSLLMDGIRRIDELSLFRARIAGAGTVLRRRESAKPVTLRPTEAALLALVDGRRTVAEIATGTHLNEFDATKILFHLSEAGLVEALAGAAPSSEGERLAALVKGMNELLRGVAQAVPPGARAGLLDSAQRFLWDAANPHAPLLRELTVAGDGGLDDEQVIAAVGALSADDVAALDPSGSRARVATDGLRDCLFFWLFLVGDKLPRESDDALGRAVRQRLGPLEALATAAP